MFNAITNKILDVAASQVGVREINGTNTGKEVNAYLASVGLAPGQYWCAAFVYWCIEQTDYVVNPLKKTGGVLAMWKDVPVQFRNTSPKPGYLGIINLGKGMGHIFFVDKIISADTIQTIEGNTNNNGSNNGIGVFKLSRNIHDKKIIGYINLPAYIASTNNILDSQKKK